jgi:hypothetical protein
MMLVLVALFNAILRTQYFPPVWKHARVISFLKPGKDPALPSPYRPISLLETIRKVFEKILLCRILSEVSERGLLSDEQFGFRPKHSISLQLAPLLKKYPGALSRSGSQALFSLMWPRHLTPYGSTALSTSSWPQIPLLPGENHSTYLRIRTFEVSFQAATTSHRRMRAGVEQGI